MTKKEDKLPKPSTIQYGLREIITGSHSIFNPSRKPSGENVDLAIAHTVSPDIRYNIEEDLILINIKVRTFIKGTDETLLQAENVFVYHAVNLKSYMEHDKDKNTLKFLDEKNEQLIPVLMGISLSTMRGIVYEKSRGTVVEFAPIPIMNPSGFISKKPFNP